jgi:hypothetical protein
MSMRAGFPRHAPRARAAGRARALVVLGLCAAVAGPARAQHGFVPPEDRALHERLAVARIVAIATVADVGLGRIAFETALPVLGSVAPEFEIKRSPSKPPPWRVGERAVLLLSGARSPYRWIERPVEAITLADADAERRFAQALREMDAVRIDPVARRDLYARWSDGRDEDLARIGQRGLMDVVGMASVLDAEFALSRADVASDLERPIEVRRRAAHVAARHPDGIAALLRHLARTTPGTDVVIAEVALQSGLLVRDPAVELRLVEVLAAPETDLGQLGLRFSALATGPEVERKLSEIAVGHPDAEVRGDAVQALQQLRRNRARRGG